LLECVHDYAGRLAALGKASGLDIVSAEHTDLLACAQQAGVVYKPCGAGGGDIGIALARDSAALNDFRGIVAQRGYRPMALTVAAQGLQLTSLE
jgi:phosphomevalonate kinase